MRTPVHIHSVYFWLWKSLDREKRRQFETGLDLLTRDANVRSRHIGKPADTNRDVIECGYDYAVVLVFDNLETHNAYQAGEAHQTFLDTCADLWARVQVYDVSETIR